MDICKAVVSFENKGQEEKNKSISHKQSEEVENQSFKKQ